MVARRNKDSDWLGHCLMNGYFLVDFTYIIYLIAKKAQASIVKIIIVVQIPIHLSQPVAVG
jgi:hypothetical protein